MHHWYLISVMTWSVLYRADEGIVARKLSLRGSSLAEEMKQFSFYGRVCAMKGFLQALPKEVLCSKVHMLPSVAPLASHCPPSSSSGSKQAHSNSSAPSLSRPSLDTHAFQTDSTALSASDSRSTDHAAAAEASDTHKTDAQCERTGSDAAQHFTHDLRCEEQGKQKPHHDALPMSQDEASTAGTAGTADSAGTAGSAGSAWMLLSDGALPACCAAVQQSTDAHHKFHAMSALAFCLERIKQCLQVCPICKLCLTLCLPCACLCACACA